MERLSSRVRLPWAVQVLVFVAVLTALVVGVDRWVMGVPIWLIVGLPFGLFGLGVLYVFARYRRWAYTLDEDALVLERGVVTHVSTVVPYVRIQHVDTRRGPLQRLIGLSSLVVYTAGTRGSDVTIPGLATDTATQLQAKLRDLAREAEPSDAV